MGFSITKNTDFSFGGYANDVSVVTVTYYYFPNGMPAAPVSVDVTVIMNEWTNVRFFPTAGALYVSVVPKVPAYGQGEYKGGNVVN